jgi:Protein of unknown function (DUF1360)
MASEAHTASDGLAQGARRAVEGYAPDEDRPIGPYLVLSGAFGVALAGALAVAKRSGREPDRPGALDVVLAGLATQKLSRLLTKDKVTSFLRAPFTRLEEPSGYGELSEQPRGSGMRHAVGELLVCPYCLGQWVAGGFAVGWVYAPRTTRLLAAMWAAESVADAAQIAYSAAEQRA